MEYQRAMGMLGTNNPWTISTGTTGGSLLSSPITYTTSTNAASSSYSTTGALNKQ